MNNTTEWSLEFDLLYRNLTSASAPGLTEYEKSVLLTDSQLEVAQGLYNGNFGKPLENDEEVTSYLNTIVRQEELTQPVNSAVHVTSDSEIFSLEGLRVMYIIFEKCGLSGDMFDCEGGTVDVPVVPVTHDEYWRTSRNPFRGAGKRRVLRLSHGTQGEGLDVADNYRFVELIPPKGASIDSYMFRYVMRPFPIILADLPQDLTIDGESTAMTCQLPASVHSVILENAVAKAKAIWAQ